MHFAVVYFKAIDIFGFEYTERHWVDDGVLITGVAVVVDRVCCLVFGLVLFSLAWIST
jgi:hypothetical protein